jgi:3'(2'), 5'-bisphosphate nucleotidase
MNSTITSLLEIIRDAAEVVLEIYRNPFGVDYKAPRDPVTAADRRANELICRRLQQVFPDVPVVAEESDPESFADFRSSDRIFFVDPVDGTREFVDRNDEFVIMIGMVCGERAELGVISAPALGTIWVGQVDEGAIEIDGSGKERAIEASTTKTLSEARIVASRSHRNAALESALEALRAAKLLSLGSAGLKGAAVARADADAYVAPHYAGQRWDVCAVDALVNAAGGRVTDAYGKAIDYRAASIKNDRGVVVSNGLLHSEILERLSVARNR